MLKVLLALAEALLRAAWTAPHLYATVLHGFTATARERALVGLSLYRRLEAPPIMSRAWHPAATFVPRRPSTPTDCVPLSATIRRATRKRRYLSSQGGEEGTSAASNIAPTKDQHQQPTEQTGPVPLSTPTRESESSCSHQLWHGGAEGKPMVFHKNTFNGDHPQQSAEQTGFVLLCALTSGSIGIFNHLLLQGCAEGSSQATITNAQGNVTGKQQPNNSVMLSNSNDSLIVQTPRVPLLSRIKFVELDDMSTYRSISMKKIPPTVLDHESRRTPEAARIAPRWPRRHRHGTQVENKQAAAVVMETKTSDRVLGDPADVNDVRRHAPLTDRRLPVSTCSEDAEVGPSSQPAKDRKPLSTSRISDRAKSDSLPLQRHPDNSSTFAGIPRTSFACSLWLPGDCPPCNQRAQGPTSRMQSRSPSIIPLSADYSFPSSQRAMSSSQSKIYTSKAIKHQLIHASHQPCSENSSSGAQTKLTNSVKPTLSKDHHGSRKNSSLPNRLCVGIPSSNKKHFERPSSEQHRTTHLHNSQSHSTNRSKKTTNPPKASICDDFPIPIGYLSQQLPIKAGKQTNSLKCPQLTKKSTRNFQRLKQSSSVQAKSMQPHFRPRKMTPPTHGPEQTAITPPNPRCKQPSHLRLQQPTHSRSIQQEKIDSHTYFPQTICSPNPQSVLTSDDVVIPPKTTHDVTQSSPIPERMTHDIHVTHRPTQSDTISNRSKTPPNIPQQTTQSSSVPDRTTRSPDDAYVAKQSTLHSEKTTESSSTSEGTTQVPPTSQQMTHSAHFTWKNTKTPHVSHGPPKPHTVSLQTSHSSTITHQTTQLTHTSEETTPPFKITQRTTQTPFTSEPLKEAPTFKFMMAHPSPDSGKSTLSPPISQHTAQPPNITYHTTQQHSISKKTKIPSDNQPHTSRSSPTYKQMTNPLSGTHQTTHASPISEQTTPRPNIPYHTTESSDILEPTTHLPSAAPNQMAHPPDTHQANQTTANTHTTAQPYPRHQQTTQSPKIAYKITQQPPPPDQMTLPPNITQEMKQSPRPFERTTSSTLSELIDDSDLPPTLSSQTPVPSNHGDETRSHSAPRRKPRSASNTERSTRQPSNIEEQATYTPEVTKQPPNDARQAPQRPHQPSSPFINNIIPRPATSTHEETQPSSLEQMKNELRVLQQTSPSSAPQQITANPPPLDRETDHEYGPQQQKSRASTHYQTTTSPAINRTKMKPAAPPSQAKKTKQLSTSHRFAEKPTTTTKRAQSLPIPQSMPEKPPTRQETEQVLHSQVTEDETSDPTPIPSQKLTTISPSRHQDTAQASGPQKICNPTDQGTSQSVAEGTETNSPFLPSENTEPHSLLQTALMECILPEENQSTPIPEETKPVSSVPQLIADASSTCEQITPPSLQETTQPPPCSQTATDQPSNKEGVVESSELANPFDDSAEEYFHSPASRETNDYPPLSFRCMGDPASTPQQSDHNSATSADDTPGPDSSPEPIDSSSTSKPAAQLLHTLQNSQHEPPVVPPRPESPQQAAHSESVNPASDSSSFQQKRSDADQYSNFRSSDGFENPHGPHVTLSKPPSNASFTTGSSTNQKAAVTPSSLQSRTNEPGNRERINVHRQLQPSSETQDGASSHVKQVDNLRLRVIQPKIQQLSVTGRAVAPNTNFFLRILTGNQKQKHEKDFKMHPTLPPRDASKQVSLKYGDHRQYQLKTSSTDGRQSNVSTEKIHESKHLKIQPGRAPWKNEKHTTRTDLGHSRRKSSVTNRQRMSTSEDNKNKSET